MRARRDILRATLRRWFRHPLGLALLRDDGSIMLAMLVMITVTGIGMVVTPMFLLQVDTTKSDIARATQLTAARTGLDVALGHLRAANDPTANDGATGDVVQGDLSMLPCAPLLGSTSAGSSGQYSVRIMYYPSDPSFLTEEQLKAGKTCVDDQGKPPAYAMIVSCGSAGPASENYCPLDDRPRDVKKTRVLQATYPFQGVVQIGGLIHSYPAAGSADLCFDAGPTMPPVAGTTLTVQQCLPGAGQQSFTYGQNLTVLLTASATTAAPLGMCLDAGTRHVANASVTFQPCASATVPNQQWSLDNGNFVGTVDGQTSDDFCFGLTSNGPDSNVTIRNTTDCSRFTLDTTVGTGAAGSSNGQLVNFEQSSNITCLGVTGADVNRPYEIALPCQQNPDPVRIDWNQRWDLPNFVVGLDPKAAQITTSPPGSSAYCLRSPLSSAAGQYVGVAPCSDADPGQKWTRLGNTGEYFTSYQITDGAGFCLQPTDPAAVPADLDSGNSKIVVATCNGSTLQKWNAPASTSQTGALTDVAER